MYSPPNVRFMAKPSSRFDLYEGHDFRIEKRESFGLTFEPLLENLSETGKIPRRYFGCGVSEFSHCLAPPKPWVSSQIGGQVTGLTEPYLEAYYSDRKWLVTQTQAPRLRVSSR